MWKNPEILKKDNDKLYKKEVNQHFETLKKSWKKSWFDKAWERISYIIQKLKNL